MDTKAAIRRVIDDLETEIDEMKGRKQDTDLATGFYVGKQDDLQYALCQLKLVLADA
ncbi:hypothetical protein [Paenibacillus rigui]|uniref:hypothetical protein n=1 Tax=Paenibacillus rigui TaxID=554312 RepID=UPI0015C66190|nr:hypothetical protein [Paenibacillus rigui]